MDSRVTGDETPPYLVVLERFVPGEDAPGTVLAIGQRVEATDPPLIVLLGGEGVLEGPAAPDPLFEVSNSEPSTPSEVLGNGWRATADDGFLRLEVLNGSQTWRAAIGSPLWSDGRHLVNARGEKGPFIRLPTPLSSHPHPNARPRSLLSQPPAPSVPGDCPAQPASAQLPSRPWYQRRR